jgi:hypothetical protein
LDRSPVEDHAGSAGGEREIESGIGEDARARNPATARARSSRTRSAAPLSRTGDSRRSRTRRGDARSRHPSRSFSRSRHRFMVFVTGLAAAAEKGGGSRSRRRRCTSLSRRRIPGDMATGRCRAPTTQQIDAHPHAVEDEEDGSPKFLVSSRIRFRGF